jgi:hypothetical protein
VALAPELAVAAGHLEPLSNLVGRVVGLPLLGGNHVGVLIDGDEAEASASKGPPRSIDDSRQDHLRKLAA